MEGPACALLNTCEESRQTKEIAGVRMKWQTGGRTAKPQGFDISVEAPVISGNFDIAFKLTRGVDSR